MIRPDRSESVRRATFFFGSLERLVGSGIAVVAACIIGLAGYCLYLFPTLRSRSIEGLIDAVVLVLVATGYALLGWFGSRSIERRHSRVLRLAQPWALGAGAMFGLSMLGEYVVPHDNRQGAMVTIGVFGTFFEILFASGCFTAATAARMTAGAIAGFWTAVIASELWVLFLFLVYLSFVGTA
jgi:hypothetical protein